MTSSALATIYKLTTTFKARGDFGRGLSSGNSPLCSDPMDPASIVQLTQGSLSLALQCGHAVKTLSDITTKCKNTKISITSMAQNVDVIQLAWSEMGEWCERYESRNTPEDKMFLERLRRSLDNGTLVMTALEQDLKPYQTNNLSFKQRSRFIWNENTLRDHQDRISHQATAMNCLMQAIQLKSIIARSQLLEEVKPILSKSDESAYSIVPSRMSSRISKSTSHTSVSHEDAEMSYRRLSFEDDLFTAKVYKRNYRNPMINRLFRSSASLSAKSQALGNGYRTLVYSERSKSDQIPDAPKNQQVHFQREFVKEQASKTSSRADVEALFEDQEGAILLQACHDADLKLIESLLSGRGTFAEETPFRRHLLEEALEHAAVNGDDSIVRALLRFNVPVQYRPWGKGKERCGWSPLQQAVNSGDATMTCLLIEAGADVSSEISGSKPLHIACHIGDLNIMKLLIDAGAPVSSTDRLGFQPIHIVSAYQEQASQIILLIDRGAKFEAEDVHTPSWQIRPLQLSCLTGQVDNAQALLERGAMTDIGESLLHMPLGIAIRQRHVAIVALLLKYGANPNARSRSATGDSLEATGMTPLCLLAAQLGNGLGVAPYDHDILDLLLKYKANFTASDDSGDQALHYLCKRQKSVFDRHVTNRGLISTFLSLRELDLKATDGQGKSALFLAATKFNFELVELLLYNGAARPESSELFLISAIADGARRAQPHLRQAIMETMEILDPPRKKEKEKVPRLA